MAEVKKIDEEVFNAIKAEFEKYPNVESVEIQSDSWNREEIVVHYKKADNEFTQDMLNRETGPISKILNSFGLEVGGIGQIGNYDARLAAEKEFKEKNPEPVDPTRPNYIWMKRSYYDRTKGEGSRILAKYKSEHADWLKRMQAVLPPFNLPGCVFSIFTKGYSDEVQSFYDSLKYKGD